MNEEEKIKNEGRPREQTKENSTKDKSKGKIVWEFINSSFFLWFLSAVIISSATFLYNQHRQSMLDASERNSRISRLDFEIESRISQFWYNLKPFLSESSDSSFKISFTDDSLKYYWKIFKSSPKNFPQLSSYIYDEYETRTTTSLMFELSSLLEAKYGIRRSDTIKFNKDSIHFNEVQNVWTAGLNLSTDKLFDRPKTGLTPSPADLWNDFKNDIIKDRWEQYFSYKKVLETFLRKKIVMIGDLDESSDIPCVTGVGDRGFYFFRKSNDGHIEFSNGLLGGAGSSWQSIKNEIINGSAPTAASIGSTIYVIIKDQNNNLKISQGSNGNFSQWQSMDFNTDAKPSLSSVGGNTLYYFAKKNGHIFYAHGQVSSNKFQWKEIDGDIMAKSGPSSGSVGNQIFVAIRGANDSIYYNQADIGSGGLFNSRWNVLDFKSSTAPNVIGVGKYFYVFAISTIGEVWFNRAALGNSFEGWNKVSGKAHTNLPVSAGGVANSYIFISAKDINGNIILNQGDVASPGKDQIFQEHWAGG